MACCTSAFWMFISALLYVSCSFPLQQQSSFSNSLRFIRTIRARVQHLLVLYKQQQFGDSAFEDRKLVLNSLPTVTISYSSWVQMQDIDRLSAASHDLYTFWTHLESQRQILNLERDEEREKVMQRRNKRGRPQLSLSQTMRGIQLDLRDLMRQVRSQLAGMKASNKEPAHTSTPSSAISSPAPAVNNLQSLNPTSSKTYSSSIPTSSLILSKAEPHTLTSASRDIKAISKRRSVTAGTVEASTQASTFPVVEPKQTTQVSGPSRWVSRLEGYVILRDLARYLSRLARDYTLLRSKS